MWPFPGHNVGVSPLFQDAGLPSPRLTSYKNVSMNGILGRSFPESGATTAKTRAMFEASLVDEATGVSARRLEDGVHFDDLT